MGALTGGGVTLGNMDAQNRQRTSDSQEQQRHYRGQPYISIRPIAQRIAGQPIRLALIGGKPKGKANRLTETRQYHLPEWVKSWARKGYGRNEGDLTIVDQHPILDSLHDPNPDIPSATDWCLKYFTVANLELTGYAYLWMPKIKGRIQYWWLPSNWVYPVVTDKALFDHWALRIEGSAEETDVPLEEIAVFYYPDPANPFHGLGPLEAGAREIMVSEFVTEAQKRVFQLGPHPSAIIKAGSVKTSDGKTISPRLKNWQLEQMVQSIKARYVGMLHYGEPMVLDRLIESITPYGRTPNEMDFGMNADKARERVEQVFGTNPYIVGAAGMGSRAESAVADAHFCHSTVNPKIELISRVLTIAVVPRFDTSGRYVLFIEPARPNDPEMEQKEWEQGQKYGAVLINEYRTSVLRLPPVPWGDAVMLSQGSSIIPIAQLKDGYIPAKPAAPGASPDATPALPAAEPTDQNPVDDDAVEEQDAEEAMGDEADKSVRRFRKVFDDAFYDQFVETWLKVHSANETSMSATIEAFLKEQGEDVTSKLESAYQSKGYRLSHKANADELLPEIFNPKDWDAKFRETVKPAFVYAVVAGATQELAAFGDYENPLALPDDAPDSAKDVGFNINFEFGVDLPPSILASINSAVDDALSKDYWSEIQETTRDRLNTSLKSGIEAGDTLREMVKRIKDDVFEGTVGKDRAENIARTETTNALGAGADAARIELADEELIEGKEWFATYDGRTRGSHLSANGQQKAVDEPFEVGGYQARWPGDPNIPAKERCRCRCASASVTVFTKRKRGVRVKAIYCQHCEVHGK